LPKIAAHNPKKALQQGDREKPGATPPSHHVSSIPAKLWRVHLAETWIKYHLSLPSQPPIFPGPLLRLGKEVAAQGGHHTDLSQELGFSQQARQTAV
jgi:hypothetical protein